MLCLTIKLNLYLQLSLLKQIILQQTTNMDSLVSSSTNVRKNFFPYKLMNILSSPLFADCITWKHDGTAFIFLDHDKFAQKYQTIFAPDKNDDKNDTAAAPASSSSSLSSKRSTFRRKLNRWGFKMHLKRDANYGMYSHKYFRRDSPKLCEKMTCEKYNISISCDSSNSNSYSYSHNHSHSSSHKKRHVSDIYETNDIDHHQGDQVAMEQPVQRMQVSYDAERYVSNALENKLSLVNVLIYEKLHNIRLLRQSLHTKRRRREHDMLADYISNLYARGCDQSMLSMYNAGL